MCQGNTRMRKHPIFGPVTASLFFFFFCGGIKDTHAHSRTRRHVSACSTLLCVEIRAKPNSTYHSLLSPFHHVSSEALQMKEDREQLGAMVTFHWPAFGVGRKEGLALLSRENLNVRLNAS